MDDEQKLKIGVKQGGGRQPGYEWNVLILESAYRESRALLTHQAYQHIAMQVKELARQSDPTHSELIDVRPIEGEGFHELRERGGPLGGLNVRLFYGSDDKQRAIIVLGVITKQNNGPTPLGDKFRMRRRWRNYRTGVYGMPKFE